MANLQLTSNMRMLRLKNNMTQLEISRRLNISRQAYSNYETGRREMAIDLIAAIADLFSITIDALVRHSVSPCDEDGIIRESHGPYTSAIEIDTADTLYLTKEEVNFILGYRIAPESDRTMINKIIALTKPQNETLKKH